jgi:hypothetical protein
MSFESTTVELPVVVTTNTCKVDAQYAHWFRGRLLYWVEERGLCFLVDKKAYWVHDK